MTNETISNIDRNWGNVMREIETDGSLTAIERKLELLLLVKSLQSNRNALDAKIANLLAEIATL